MMNTINYSILKKSEGNYKSKYTINSGGSTVDVTRLEFTDMVLVVSTK